MKSMLLATSAVMATLLFVGCGAENTGAGTDGDTPAESGTSIEGDGEPAKSSVNPVEVLTKVPDCTIGEGVESGQPDVNGNLYASCVIEDVEFVEDGTAYTTDVDVTARAVDPAVAEALGSDTTTSDDSHKVIFGDGFYLVVTASPAVFGTGALDVETVAAAVDGQVV